MVLLGIFMEFRNMHHFIFKNKIVSIPNTRESELKTSAPSLYKYLIFFPFLIGLPIPDLEIPGG